MAHDVLNLHDGVVNQKPNHERERQERHHVDRETEIVHADESGNGRQRQRNRRHQRRAPFAQEQQHHEHGEERAFQQQFNGRVVLFLHRRHEIKCLRELEAWVFKLDLLKHGEHTFADFNFTGSATARHLEANHRLAVE